MRDSLRGLVAARHRLVPLDVDADPERPDVNHPIAKGDHLPNGIDPRLGNELLHAVHEILRVSIDLELREIIAEHPAQQRLVRPGRQAAEEYPAVETGMCQN